MPTFVTLLQWTQKGIENVKDKGYAYLRVGVDPV